MLYREIFIMSEKDRVVDPEPNSDYDLTEEQIRAMQQMHNMEHQHERLEGKLPFLSFVFSHGTCH